VGRVRVGWALGTVAVGCVVGSVAGVGLMWSQTWLRPAGAPMDRVVVASAAVSQAEQIRVADFWTPQRMRAAARAGGAGVQAAAGGPTNGRPVAVWTKVLPGSVGSASVVAQNQAMQIVAAQSASWQPGGRQPALYRSTTGKVFGTLPDGRNFGCSGNVVRSENRDVVATAGHCLYQSGQYASNVVFVPFYECGEPMRTWTARAMAVPPVYAYNGSLNYDTGFLVLNTFEGEHVADRQREWSRPDEDVVKTVDATYQNAHLAGTYNFAQRS
jgi:hypothetical protein